MKILIAFMLISAAYAMHLEYLNVDLDEEQDNDSLVGQGEDAPEISCFVCKKAVNWIKKHLGDNERASAIKQKLHTICKIIPGPMKNTCKKIIGKYIDILTEELSTSDDPATICAKIHWCKSKSLLEFIQDFPEVQQML